MKRAITLFVLSTMALTGCAFESGEPEATLEETPVVITSIETLPDGTQAVRTSEWSRAQLREAMRERIRLAAENGVHLDPAQMGLPDADEASAEESEGVREAAQAIYLDRLCQSSTALWITDNGSYGDINHMLCFEDAGYMDIPSDWWGAYWGGAHTPVAIYPGARGGQLWYLNSYCDVGCSVSFQAWTQKSLQTYPGPNSKYAGVSLL